MNGWMRNDSPWSTVLFSFVLGCVMVSYSFPEYSKLVLNYDRGEPEVRATSHMSQES